MKLALLLLTLVSANFLNAQEPIYKWGEAITNTDLDSKLEKILGTDDNGIYLVRSAKSVTTRDYWVEHIGPDLSQVSYDLLSFDVGVMGALNSLEDFERIGEQNFAFIEKWNKGAEKKSLHIARIEGTTLVDETEIGAIPAKKQWRSGHFHHTFSPDKSKLLVFMNLPYEKKTQAKIAFNVFDTRDWSKLYRKEITLDIESEKGIDNAPAVDNQGNVFLFKKRYVKPSYQYTLYTYEHAGDKWQSTVLNLKDKSLVDYKMVFDQNNSFCLFGTYAIDKTLSIGDQVNGYFLYKMNSAFTGFELEIMRDWSEVVLQGTGRGSKTPEDGTTIGGYRLKDVLFRSDDTPLVLLEEYTQKRSGIPGSQPAQYQYTYTYGDILTIALSKTNGQPMWAQRITKKQELVSDSEIDKFGSFIYYLNHDRLVIIYNNTVLSGSSIPPAFWKEANGTKYVKKDVFGDKTIHASFLRVVEPDGSLAFGDRKYGLPLRNMHKGAVFPMSMVTDFYIPYNDGVVIRAEMHNGGKRYKYGLISF